MSVFFSTLRNEEIMDVLLDVCPQDRQGVRLVFIDSEGREVALRLPGNVARDLRDELNEFGEALY